METRFTMDLTINLIKHRLVRLERNATTVETRKYSGVTSSTTTKETLTIDFK